MGSAFFDEGGARSFCFFYKPEGMGLLELPAEGRSFAFIFQYHEKGGAGAGHKDGTGEGVQGAGGFPEDGVQWEKGRFKIIGQGGKEKGKVSCLKGFDAAAGIVFQALWKGVDGGVGSGGGFRGLGADDEEGKPFPGGQGGELIADAFAAGAPPATQKGMSAPREAPMAARSEGESPVLYRAARPRSTAAASEEPPPIPAWEGISLARSWKRRAAAFFGEKAPLPSS